MPITPQEALQRTIEHREIFHDEMVELMRQIMRGEISPLMAAAILTGLRVKKETVGEIAGAAQVMREFSAKVAVGDTAHFVDIVGTGGDGAHSFNISTASMFVVAAAGAKVAKHGNRSVSSKSGSADVLEALGAAIDLQPAEVAQCVARTGIGFMFAPIHHPAMRNVAPVRREMGVRTIFNILGPLSNPAGVTRQFTGVFARRWVEPLAQVLKNLGCEACWVVHGEDGLDELTTTGASYVAELKDGTVRTFTVTPADAGLPTARPEDLKGGSPEVNAQAIRDLLAGKAGAYRDIVLFNAAASLVVAGKTQDLESGAALAARAIDDGAAQRALERLVAITNGGA